MSYVFRTSLPRIVSVEYREGDASAVVTELCDEYFSLDMSKAELEEFGNDILSIAFMMKDKQ